MNKKFVDYPLVLDWLQWGEFESAHTAKIDYPQAALTLLAEMRAYIRELETGLTEAATALEAYSDGDRTPVATEALQSLKRFIGEDFYPEPGAQAQPNLNDNPESEEEAY